MSETTVTCWYVDRDGKRTGRRNAVRTAYKFSRIHSDGHEYWTTMQSKIGIKPSSPLEIQAKMTLDEYLYEYDTNDNHKRCTHPLKARRFDNEEYGGATCTICKYRFQNNGGR